MKPIVETSNGITLSTQELSTIEKLLIEIDEYDIGIWKVVKYIPGQEHTIIRISNSRQLTIILRWDINIAYLWGDKISVVKKMEDANYGD